MNEDCQHAWEAVEGSPGVEHCPLCHGARYVRPAPERAPPAPAIAGLIDRALSADPWQRIARRHVG